MAIFLSRIRTILSTLKPTIKKGKGRNVGTSFPCHFSDENEIKSDQPKKPFLSISLRITPFRCSTFEHLIKRVTCCEDPKTSFICLVHFEVGKHQAAESNKCDLVLTKNYCYIA